MTQQKKVAYQVEGPGWTREVLVDSELHDDERSQLIEAGTLALEAKIKEDEALSVGAVLSINKKGKKSKEALVNAYLCLINASQHKIAESLRQNFKKETGNDLAMDEKGFSY